MGIGITYNLKSVTSGEHNEEFDSIQTIDAICKIFEKNGFETLKLGGDIDVAGKVKNEKVEFVFNIAEGYYGRNRESWIPSILEMMNIPYSGSDPLSLGLALDKVLAKKLFQYAKIPSPSYTVIKKIEDIREADARLQYPLIVKPAWQGSSKGIYASSKVYDKADLARNAEILLKKYPREPILAEEYIKGREVTVGVLGNEAPKVLGIMEVLNKIKPGEDFFYSIEVKRDWKNLVDYESPANIPQSLDSSIRRHATVAFREFGLRDIARMDFRVSEYGEPYLLEINPLPGLSPESGDLVIMAQKNGIGYEELILMILNAAFSRYGFERPVKKEMNYEKI